MIRLTSFANTFVAVFGLGGSGLAAAHALKAGGAKVIVWDDTEAARATATEAGHTVVDLSGADWTEISALVLAPGVPLTHPQPHWTVVKARDSGTEIIGDVELFARERKASAPVAPLIAITGTNGKSTTTALIAHLLRQLGCEVCVGGNIGKAILTLEPPAANRIHVVEMSSYQIDLTPTLAPTVGVLLNVTPDHLDRHGTIEHYASVKARLVQDANAACICVDDHFTRAIAHSIEPSSRLYAFTKGQDAFLNLRATAMGSRLFVHSSQDGKVVSEEIADLDGCASLRGAHNVENALAAVIALRALADQCSGGALRALADQCSGGALRALADQSAGTNSKRADLIWQPQVIQKGLQYFPGLAYRLQQIGQRGSVLFFNDSKATNAESTEKALASFTGDIYWIVGGRAKDAGIAALKPLFSRVSKAYLIGEAANDFAHTLTGQVDFETVATLDRAVQQASQDAARSNADQPVVLLSPACASFDQYRNFELRGAHFTELVAALPGVEMLEATT